MSHTPQPTVVVHRSESNGLGLAGFICSLIGLLSCGALFPVGLVGLALSFFGMFKRPRGLAIAGFVIGLVANLWIIVAVVFVGFSAILAGAAAMVGAEKFEAAFEMGVIGAHVDEYLGANGRPPSTLTILGLETNTLEDPWGRTYRYAPTADGLSYTLSSDGPDGVEGTPDDILHGD
ncbi:MAG: type II secretion system protein GspG [Phycisphaerales bacterium]